MGDAVMNRFEKEKIIASIDGIREGTESYPDISGVVESNVATAHPIAAELRGMPCRRLTTRFYSKSKSFTYCINTVACMF